MADRLIAERTLVVIDGRGLPVRIVGGQPVPPHLAGLYRGALAGASRTPAAEGAQEAASSASPAVAARTPAPAGQKAAEPAEGPAQRGPRRRRRAHR